MSYSDLVKNTAELAKTLAVLTEESVAHYRPVVESIIASRCQDAGRIECTLDHLLDCCAHDSGVVLFRQLCRHY